jgi:hypothetical protein
MNDYDYCTACNGIFDYLDLKPYELRWYCRKCYKEIRRKEALAISQHR